MKKGICKLSVIFSFIITSTAIQLAPVGTAHAEGIIDLITSPFSDNYFTIEDGELQRPTGFREWVYIGTPVTPNDMNDGKAAFPEFHNVYIDPDSWAHW